MFGPRMDKQAEWLVSAFKAECIIEHFMPSDIVGVDQGSALWVPADAVVKTCRGIWVTGSHTAASVRGFEAHGAGFTPIEEELLLIGECTTNIRLSLDTKEGAVRVGARVRLRLRLRVTVTVTVQHSPLPRHQGGRR